jgi:hypothetical protein
MWHVWDPAGAYRVLVVRPEGNSPLGRCRCRWEDNIKIDLEEAGWEGKNRIDQAQDTEKWQALVNAIMNGRVQ